MSVTDSNPAPAHQTGTPSLLRAINERSLLDYLRHHGPTSRAQLARATGLSKPTVSQALASLEAAELVRPVGQSISSRGGRIAILYEPNPEAGYVLGVDVGRGWVRAAVADLAGHIIARDDEQDTAQDASSLVTLISRLARDLVQRAGLSWSQIVHTVIGTPGVLDPRSQRVLFSGNLPEWGKQGLLAELQAAFNLSLSVENDANLAALGERTFGWGATADTFVYITVGTGIGMGIVINGALYRGAHGAAGEIGFLPFGLSETSEKATMPGENYLLQYPQTDRRNEETHSISQTATTPESIYQETSKRSSEFALGMFEEAASARGIVQQAQEFGLPVPLSAKQVFDAAQQGDKQALAVIEQEGYRLALAIATIAAVLDPELVVLGGGIGQRIDLLQEPLERRLHHLTPLRPRIVTTQLGADSILLGAIATALETAHNLVFQHYFNGDLTATISPPT